MADELEPASAGNDQDDQGFWHSLEARQQKHLRILGFLVLISILVLLFILQNSDPVELNFIVFSFQTSLIWLIVLTYIAGALSGHLVTRLLRRRFFPPRERS
ncbi:MAG: LapA family protein [Thermoleophilia bacterium]|nr:LapA family protein [Thermoleophilia bacterium]